MHILELIKKGDENIPAAYVVESEITHVISNLYIYQTFLPSKEHREYIKSIRNDLMQIRSKVYRLLKRDGD